MFGEYPDDIDWSDPIDRGHPLAACLSMYWPAVNDNWRVTTSITGSTLALGREAWSGVPVTVGGSGIHPRLDSTLVGSRLRYRSGAAAYGNTVIKTPQTNPLRSFGCFFTCSNTAQFRNLMSNSVGSTFLLCTGTSPYTDLVGNPPGMTEYNRVSGLTVPTTGEVCLGASVNFGPGSPPLTYLFTPSAPGGQVFTHPVNYTGNSIAQDWYIGDQYAVASRQWDGCIWGAFASSLSWSQGMLAAYYQNAALFLRRTSRRSMVSVPTASGKPWLYAPHSARLVA